MERCKTCKWWAAEPNEDDEAPEDQKVRACNSPTAASWTINERYRPARNDFYYVPRSGTLYTAPGFGCVHHEAVVTDLLAELPDCQCIGKTNRSLPISHTAGRPNFVCLNCGCAIRTGN